MTITLYYIKTLKEDGRISNYRNVTAKVNDENELIICCCDINNTAKEMFGDSGVEFFLTVNEQNKDKFTVLLEITETGNLNDKLLEKIYSKFGEEDQSFSNIMDYFKSNGIKYKYDRW